MNRYRYQKKMLLVFAFMFCLQFCRVQCSTAQQAGSALKLDGRGDFVEIAPGPELEFSGPFTLEAWIQYQGEISSQAVILAKGRSAGERSGYALYLDREGHVVFYSGQGESVHLRSKTALSPAQWYHVTCLLREGKAGRSEVWVNGFLDSTGALEYPPETGEPLLIGTWGEGSDFRGEVDEVRIYNRALAPEEIEGEMAIRARGDDSGRVAGYDFDGLNSQGKVTDLSTYGHHGILQGDATLVDSEAPVFSSAETLGLVLENMMTRAEEAFDRVKVQGVLFSYEGLLTEARKAFEKEDYPAAFRMTWAGRTRFNSIQDLLRDFVRIDNDIHLEMKALDRDRISTAVIDDKVAGAKEALRGDQFESALGLISEAKVNLEAALAIYPRIEELERVVNDVDGLGCNTGPAKKKLNEAVDVFNRGGYSQVDGYVQEGLALAEGAECGRVKITNLLARAAGYDGKAVEVRGKIKDISTVYGGGHRIAVDDGTGIIWVEYQGAMKNLDYWKNLDYLDKVIVEGVFSEAEALIKAEKVR